MYKILMVGNSFSDDTIREAYPIFKQLGLKDFKLGYLYHAGCSLKMHDEYATLNDEKYVYCYTDGNGKWNTELSTVYTDKFSTAFDVSRGGETDWDIITFQQSSSNSFLPETYEKLPNVIDHVEKYITNKDSVKYGWNMTWAYKGSERYPNKTGLNLQEMYKGIVSAVKEKVLTEKRIKFVIPVGTAIQNARTSKFDTETSFHRDGLHLDFIHGRYIASLTLAGAVLNKSVKEITYKISEEISDEEREMAKECVENAILNPYTITACK